MLRQVGAAEDQKWLVLYSFINYAVSPVNR